MNPATSNGQLFSSPAFEASRIAALARIAAVRPAAYARTRNHLDGAVTRLSPYLTHGLVSLREVLAGVLTQGPLPIHHKFVFELAWREYFHHVWRHAGDGILHSLHNGVLPEAEYSLELPADLREGRTGVPVIDQAVRTLYADGYLHNHARMWLASYVVHIRKVHWRSGADWMLGYLLDGDIASNHLSWQWVAGTGSSKPYLFNAENVARYASSDWHSPGSVIDTDYEALDAIARSPRALAGSGRGRLALPAIEPPPLLAAWAGAERPDVEQVRGLDIEILHPYATQPASAPASGVKRIGLLLEEFHQRWPWSAARWDFVVGALRAHCDVIWHGNAETLRQLAAAAHSVQVIDDPHLSRWLRAGLPVNACTTPERLFVWPERPCASFSKFWTQATRGLQQAAELLPAA